MPDLPFILPTYLNKAGLQLTRYNPPGQAALTYRPGSYGLIVSRFLDELRNQKVVTEDNQTQQPLIHFNLLATDDWTVAFLRAWATVSDVLSFYQERIINEAYLRTAIERRSVFELTRAVGYELAPPVSATTYLAFTLNNAINGQKIQLSRGIAVQSAPAAFSSQDAIKDIVQSQASPAPNLPVIFETTDDLIADPAWNALKPALMLGLPWPPKGEIQRTLRLAGSTLGLKPGDALLIAGQAESKTDLPAWELLLLDKVNSQAKEGFTAVTWSQQFGVVPEGGIPHPGVQIFRRKTVLFPYAAGGVFRSTELGWAPTNIGLPPKTVQTAAVNSNSSLFVGIEQAVYSSGDRGDSWQPIAGLPPKDVHAIAADSAGAVAVGADDSGVHISKDGGSAWTALSGPAEVVIPTGWLSIFQSVRYKLPKTTIRSLLFTENNETELLAGSDDGVFGYDARHDSWISMNSRFPNLDSKKGTAPLAVRALAAADAGKRILAGTVNGVFRVESVFKGPSPLILIALLLLLLPGALSALIPNIFKSYLGQINLFFPIGVLAVLLIWLQPFRQKWIGLVLALALFVRLWGPAFSSNLPANLNTLDQNLIIAFLAWMVFSAGMAKLPELVQKYLSKLPPAVQKYVPDLAPKAKQPQVFSLLVDGAEVYAGTDHGIYHLDKLTWGVRFNHWWRQLVFGPEPEPWTPVQGWSKDAALGDSPDQVVTALALDDQGRLLAGTQAGSLYVRQPGQTQTWITGGNTPLTSIRAIVKTKNDIFTMGEPLGAPQEILWAPAQLAAGAVDVDALSLAVSAGSYAAALDGDNCSLFNVTGAVEQASHDAKKAGSLTRLTVHEKDKLPGFNRSRTQFFCHGENLPLFDDQFLPHPVQGDQIILDGQVNDLTPGKLLLISGTALDGQPRSELVTVLEAIPGEASTIVQLQASLIAAYARDSATLFGNIVPAIQGQTIRNEYLGESDGTISNQRFMLHSPLAYEPAEANDYQTSLDVFVNKIPWQQVPTLFDQPADGRVFMVRRNGRGQTAIIFGDGEQGARLPSSQEDLTATYRSGGGEAGNLPPNSLTLLQSHLPHLKSVTNPAPAKGGLPGESAGHGRERAPLRLRALGRIVTLKDYADFTATFPGVSMSAVHPVPENAPRWIDIAIVPNLGPQPDSRQIDSLLTRLADAINQSRSSAMLPFKLRIIQPAFFALGLRLYASPENRNDVDWVKNVLQAVRAKILAAYSLEILALGQAVTETDIFTLVQSVQSVTAVTLTRFYKLASQPEEPAVLDMAAHKLTANWDELLLLRDQDLMLEVAE